MDFADVEKDEFRPFSEMFLMPKNRAPMHPGEMLLEEFLKPMGITQSQLATGIGVPFQLVNEIVNGRRGVTARTALLLARYLGVSIGFWMHLQAKWDLHKATASTAKKLEAITPFASE